MRGFLILFFAANFFCFHPVRAGEPVISVPTETFTYMISNEGQKIRVSSVGKNTAASMISSSPEAPYFEFMTDKGIVSSELPVWEFKTSYVREMCNGGTEITSVFAGDGIAEGMELTLVHQYFHGSSLIRERMGLRSASGKTAFALRDGKNHFIYPRYTLPQAPESVTEWRMGTFMEENHIFITDSILHDFDGKTLLVKGPFAIADIGDSRIITSYEHASQDQAIMRGDKCGTGLWSSVGSKAVRDLSADDYWFIGTGFENFGDGCLAYQKILRGGYLDGEAVPSGDMYWTVWSTINVVPGNTDPLEEIRHYVYEQITEHPLSRKVFFYYNTWGMQRQKERAGLGLRESFNQENVIREIDCASQMGTDLIVFDDGWQDAFGSWHPDSTKIPSMENMTAYIRGKGMIPGLWISLATVDSLSSTFSDHPERIIKDADGIPISTQYKYPAADLVGDYYDKIRKDHIRLIDMGFRFFKWDAVNTFHSYLPDQGHGSGEHSRQERIDRYNYLLPFRLTSLMRELREYAGDVVVEIDLTEPERAMTGLMPLQEGKFFSVNNGASAYEDYSTLRTKSARNIANLNTDILPVEIFTYASYPHNIRPYKAMEYNIHSILMAGHGIWGNLGLLSADDRKAVRDLIIKAKRVLPEIEGRPFCHAGLTGDSPEIYWQVDTASSFGQVIAFSGAPVDHEFTLATNPDSLAAVLNHPYRLDGSDIHLEFGFKGCDDSAAAFLIGNEGEDVSVIYATGALDDILISDDHVLVIPAEDGEMSIMIDGKYSIIRYEAGSNLRFERR